jgi:hypothetical protein
LQVERASAVGAIVAAISVLLIPGGLRHQAPEPTSERLLAASPS